VADEKNFNDADQTLRLVVEGTVAETGTEFFRALVRNLATALGVAGAWVTDIALLARAFVERFARRMGRRIAPLHPDDIRRLQQYSWPGNVRELQNVIERAIILAVGGRADLHRALPSDAVPPAPPQTAAGTESPRILSASELEALERANLVRALAACGGKIAGENGVAQRLGLPPSTVSSRMKSLGIQRAN
jgi:transcriptional regulator with GAF, ATPase, and Fis domain